MLRKEGRRSVLSWACCCIFFLKLRSLPLLGMGEKLTTSVSREWGETMSDYLHLVLPAEDGLFSEISSWPLPVLCEMSFSTFYSEIYLATLSQNAGTSLLSFIVQPADLASLISQLWWDLSNCLFVILVMLEWFYGLWFWCIEDLTLLTRAVFKKCFTASWKETWFFKVFHLKALSLRLGFFIVSLTTPVLSRLISRIWN